MRCLGWHRFLVIADPVVSKRLVRTVLSLLLIFGGICTHMWLFGVQVAVLRMVCQIRSKGREDLSDIPLNLLVNLEIICGCKWVLISHHLVDALKELWCQPLAIFRNKVVGPPLVKPRELTKPPVTFASVWIFEGIIFKSLVHLSNTTNRYSFPSEALRKDPRILFHTDYNGTSADNNGSSVTFRLNLIRLLPQSGHICMVAKTFTARKGQWKFQLIGKYNFLPPRRPVN